MGRNDLKKNKHEDLDYAAYISGQNVLKFKSIVAIHSSQFIIHPNSKFGRTRR